MSFTLQPEQLKKMYSMIEAGQLYRIIGERFGVSVSVVRYHASKIGHSRQINHGKTNRGAKRLKNHSEIMELIKSRKYSDRTVALLARCSKSTVTNYRLKWQKECQQ